MSSALPKELAYYLTPHDQQLLTTTVAQLALLIEEQLAKPAIKEIESLPITAESSVDVDALLAELEQLSEGEAQSMLQLN